ncbi:histidinol-phosphate aminotransferase [Branchiibius hedensis]|uniref:Histidinol-phosphate aminotransferase n=1 Tax=Branchiibius hedensis TaxID=672460 RepID=A0A2Y9BTM1_9MICO|nr:histidinol-phosphate transaminase [Branchiibius hedensis]PWJ25419.1 histidinol-phosphate aminotransferase [Branchiibius hedensis]SSA34232.1 histidinol-phosphate aminotransferase [Branchiibius hedensis]
MSEDIQSRSRLTDLLRPDLRGQSAYGAPQLPVAVALNTNESSYSVPDDVVEAITARVAQVAPDLNRYPDREFVALRTALAGYLQIATGVELSPEQLWAGNGSNEVLSHIVQAFGGPGRVALGFTPAYSMHPIISRGAGTGWVDGLRNATGADYDVDAELAVQQVREHRPDIVFLCSPNNPTGTAIGLDIVEAVYDALPDGIVVVDEAYAEFARPGTRSALTLLPGRERLVVTRTMSKAFAFAGVRLGYLAADPELTQLLRLVRLPYHLSSVTQAVAEAALEHAGTMLSMVEDIKATRDELAAVTGQLGLKPVPSDANFVLVGGFADAAAAWQVLLDRGVLVRDVGIPNHLRITAGTPQETQTVLRVLRESIEDGSIVLQEETL